MSNLHPALPLPVLRPCFSSLQPTPGFRLYFKPSERAQPSDAVVFPLGKMKQLISVLLATGEKCYLDTSHSTAFSTNTAQVPPPGCRLAWRNLFSLPLLSAHRSDPTCHPSYMCPVLPPYRPRPIKPSLGLPKAQPLPFVPVNFSALSWTTPPPSCLPGLLTQAPCPLNISTLTLLVSAFRSRVPELCA